MKLAMVVAVLLQQQPKEEKPVRLPENYSHPFLAFKIYLPKNWARGENKGKASCSFYGPKDQMYLPRLDLFVERTKDDVATTVTRFKTAFQKQVPDAKFIREGAIGGKSGEGYTFVAEFTSDTIPTQALWGFWVSGGRAYTMSFSVTKAWSDKYIPPLEASMRTLRVYDEPTATDEQKKEFAKEYSAAGDANRKGDLDAAVRSFKRCIELIAGYPEVYSGLGIVLMKQKKYADAEVALKKAVELDPDDYSFNFNLGVCLIQTGKTAEAVKYLEKAVTIDPASEPALSNLGAAQLAADDAKKAIETLTKAVKADPESATAHYNLGLAYERSEELKKAAAEFRETLKIDAKHEKAKEALKRVTK